MYQQKLPLLLLLETLSRGNINFDRIDRIVPFVKLAHFCYRRYVRLAQCSAVTYLFYQQWLLNWQTNKNERLTQLPISFHCHSRWLLASLIVIGRWLIVSFLPSFVCRSRLLKKKRTTLAKRKSINQQSPLRWLKDWPTKVQWLLLFSSLVQTCARRSRLDLFNFMRFTHAKQSSKFCCILCSTSERTLSSNR